jgi:hypothetical protein
LNEGALSILVDEESDLDIEEDLGEIDSVLESNKFKTVEGFLSQPEIPPRINTTKKARKEMIRPQSAHVSV